MPKLRICHPVFPLETPPEAAVDESLDCGLNCPCDQPGLVAMPYKITVSTLE